MPTDYRNFIIEKWISSELETFKKPSSSDLEIHQRFYSKIIEKCDFDNDAKIFEIGFGFGSFLYTLQRQGYNNLYGIDILPETVGYVKNRLNISALRTSDALTFFDKNTDKFNAIAAFDVIEHFNKNEILYLLQKIWTALDKGGVFIMKVPNGGSLPGLYIRYSGFTHELAFTSLSATEVLKAVGFTNITVYPDTDFADKPSSVAKIIKRSIGSFLRRILAPILGLNCKFAFCTSIVAIAHKK